MSIKGGWDTTVWYGGDPGAATNIGVITRPDPIFDPALINVRGIGKRGLRTIAMGQSDPRLTFEFVPPNTDFIRTYQDGTEIATLHYKIGTDVGITLTNARVNRLSASCRAGDILRVSAEVWGESIQTLDSGCPWTGSELSDVLEWIEFIVKVAPKDDPTNVAVNSKWHEWRYEVVNNLERLASVTSKLSRSLEIKQRDISGLLIWDLEDMAEYLEYIGSDKDVLFYLQVMENANYLLGSGTGAYSQWGRLEAPHGPEDLQLKRFPFTSLTLT